MTPQFLVFTDLDGTLLDHETYSFESALPGLKALEERRIPLIFCTSKTRAETERHRKDLRNSHPFITENGGAVFIPRGYFPFEGGFADVRDDSYDILEFGAPYDFLRRALMDMRNALDPSIRGFGDMDVREIADLCAFSTSEAHLAKMREYDEPFLVPHDTLLVPLGRIAAESGLRIVRGGRFFHLIGGNDKGQAVKALKGLYAKAWGPQTSAALGDSSNDAPMLEAVDVPILVRKAHGGYESGIATKGLTITQGIGPEGWNEAVLEFLLQDGPIAATDTGEDREED